MPLTSFEENHKVDEETPLLPDRKIPSISNPTQMPLPIAQITIVLTVWLAESIISQLMSPYLNQVLDVLDPADWC